MKQKKKGLFSGAPLAAPLPGEVKGESLAVSLPDEVCEPAPITHINIKMPEVLDKPRLPSILVTEIQRHIKQAEREFITIGNLLNEAKADISLQKNAAFTKWLKENFNLSHRSANRFMRLAKNFPNSPTLANLGLTRSKADVLLRLEDGKRNEFVCANPDIGDIGTRDLEKRVREYIDKDVVDVKPKANKVTPIFTPKNDVEVHERIEFLDDMIQNLVACICGKRDDNSKDACIKLRRICDETVEKMVTNIEEVNRNV
jgi:hypothetical protein